MDDAFSAYKNVCVLDENQKLIIDEKHEGVSRKSFYYPLLEEERAFIEIKTQGVYPFSNRKKKKEIIGKFEIYLSKQLLFSGNLYKL